MQDVPQINLALEPYALKNYRIIKQLHNCVVKLCDFVEQFCSKL